MQQNPGVGAGAVVFKDHQILLIQRGRNPGKGDWSIPGGKQKMGELIQETAKREVMEETGILISDLHLLDAVNFIERDKNGAILFHYTVIDFAADWVSGDVKAGDDAMQALWVDIEDVHQYKLWSELERIIKLALLRRKQTVTL